jgi:hypothetical protein
MAVLLADADIFVEIEVKPVAEGHPARGLLIQKLPIEADRRHAGGQRDRRFCLLRQQCRHMGGRTRRKSLGSRRPFELHKILSEKA